MLSIFLPLLATLVSFPAVNGHAMFQGKYPNGLRYIGLRSPELWVGSTDARSADRRKQGSTCVRMPWRNSPITDVTSTDMACNTATSAASPGYCSVAAGGTLTVEMHSQPNDRSCSVDAIGGNHDGPVIIYMAKVDNALTADGATAKWFKVAQSGYLGDDYWATDALNANCGKSQAACLPESTLFVPKLLVSPTGDLRWGLTSRAALHVAYQLGGAQFYMSCYTVKVTGGGSASPATVSLPGAVCDSSPVTIESSFVSTYAATDPGILFDPYSSFTSYTIPGPSVFTCSGGTSVSTLPPPQSSTSTRVTSTSSRSSSTSTSTSTRSSSTSTTSTRTSSASGAGQTLYGQCGGQGWTGPTTCAQGTCKVLNPFYSQCSLHTILFIRLELQLSFDNEAEEKQLFSRFDQFDRVTFEIEIENLLRDIYSPFPVSDILPQTPECVSVPAEYTLPVSCPELP
ncbi:related to endoglucanase IV [Serendipita indica DSM 11827]|uniref:AA9 family lytic polysaccharide monooxygenase n=1 Tax=Serendipita indica (strain DSM 11827) TaxID=1109443 RepID=G4TLL9_SERID|nr:related to endoglucanase IV [Serendipita indica DSM 11827]